MLKVVLPTVMRIDESHSADGRSLEDLGYTYGEDVEQGTEPDKHGGEVRIWRNDAWQIFCLKSSSSCPQALNPKPLNPETLEELGV